MIKFILALAVCLSLYGTEFNRSLFEELTIMVEADQTARFEVIKEGLFGTDEGNMLLDQIDLEHLPRLQMIVKEFGWPGIQLVGEEGATKAWLLVQHCDKDIEFQKNCLILLKEAMLLGDAPKWHYAYLMDRVLVNENKLQLYGTQVEFEGGKFIPHPIDDFENVDKRREEMGLGSYAEYLLFCYQSYQKEKN